jgi:Ca-activated chloride channel family protein
MRVGVRAVVVGVCVLLLAVAAEQSARVLGAAAQELATISGVVRDASGTVLPGVTVTISGPERRSTVSNQRGEFLFVNVRTGEYEVRYELAGFSPLIVTVTARAGSTEQLRAELRVGSVADTVTVTSEAPVADVQSLARQATQDARKEQSAQAPPPPAAIPSGVVGGIGPGSVGGVAGGSYRAGNAALYLPGRNDGPFDTESYDHIDEAGFRQVTADPLSTFSIDVDTASYANLRRFINHGTLPPAGAIRTEELINYFRFDYHEPVRDEPFSITTELAACPWAPGHRLALVGIQGRSLQEEQLPPRNLVFLIDVSGSMNSPDKLPLVQRSLQLLADRLTERDRLSIVVYAGASGLVLPPTSGDRRHVIREAIASLRPGGSTNGAAGIRLAYDVARAHFDRRGVNRVVLATDGDFNVGVTSQSELVDLIEHERESGVFLSVLGVGTGNLKDSTMEKLADKGNGNYSYLDSLDEAKKVLVREAGGTLVTIAKDVKIQVEFNPRAVAAYRLIGYENRALRNEDFNDDKKDAGEIGAGHSVTALYEIVPAGAAVDAPSVDPLKYQRQTQPSRAASARELATIKVRYKQPQGSTSMLVSTVLGDRVRPMTPNIGFASAVAEFAMLVRDSDHTGLGSYDSVIARARQHAGPDLEGYRGEFVRLVDAASRLARGGRLPSW